MNKLRAYPNNNLSNTVKISPELIKNAIIDQGNVQNRLFNLGVTLSDGTIAYLNVDKDTARATTYKDGTWTDLYTLATKSDLDNVSNKLILNGMKTLSVKWANDNTLEFYVDNTRVFGISAKWNENYS